MEKPMRFARVKSIVGQRVVDTGIPQVSTLSDDRSRQNLGPLVKVELSVR